MDVKESPTGEYQIVSWLVDQGGFGYSGAFYIKEKGLFSQWNKLGTGPSSVTWLSDTEFSIYDSGYKEKVYNTENFFGK